MKEKSYKLLDYYVSLKRHGKYDYTLKIIETCEHEFDYYLYYRNHIKKEQVYDRIKEAIKYIKGEFKNEYAYEAIKIFLKKLSKKYK